MTRPQFDAFIAIDWSGARGSYRGIAVVRCERGRGSPRLVRPARGGRWTRSQIASWLIEQLGQRERLLIGLDFGFGLPYEPRCGYLGGGAPGVDNIFDLWTLIDEASCDEPDFGCSSFLNDSRFEPLFWKSGRMPNGWTVRKRRTEHACAAETGTHPDTLYKLLGSKQVGKASITGMRVLRHVRSRRRNSVAIWPFESVRTSALVEIYPTLFRKRAAQSIAKIRSVGDLNRALAVLGSQGMKANGKLVLSDHETDAMLSAAGLRAVVDMPALWSSTRHPREAKHEGWIFGVAF